LKPNKKWTQENAGLAVLKGIFKTKASVRLMSAKKIRRLLSFSFKKESEVVSNACQNGHCQNIKRNNTVAFNIALKFF